MKPLLLLCAVLVVMGAGCEQGFDVSQAAVKACVDKGGVPLFSDKSPWATEVMVDCKFK